LLHDVARVDADAQVQLLAGLFLSVVGFELLLDRLGALDSVDHGGEVHQKGVADGFDDVAMMRGDGLVDELVMVGQALEHAGFVSAHLTAKADDVGEHDRRELARPVNGWWCGFPCHARDYATEPG
jgi:hypothetical protein